jgi:hypothetical protein
MAVLAPAAISCLTTQTRGRAAHGFYGLFCLAWHFVMQLLS